MADDCECIIFMCFDFTIILPDKDVFSTPCQDDLVLGEYVNSEIDHATFNEIAQKLSVRRSTEQIKTRITELYDKRFHGSWTVKQCLLLHWLISKHGNRWTSFEGKKRL